MFLKELSEKQKRLFLELAHRLAKIDDDYNDAEKELMDAYCKEMEIEYRFRASEQSDDELIRELEGVCGDREKKMIVFELIGLSKSDARFDEQERIFINRMITVFGIENTFATACEALIDKYLQLQAEINRLVL